MAPRPDGLSGAQPETRKERLPGTAKWPFPEPGEEIVIAGISGSFPDSDGVDMFRDKLMAKVDLINDDDRRWKLG